MRSVLVLMTLAATAVMAAPKGLDERATNCVDSKTCCFKNHSVCNAKFSKDNCNRNRLATKMNGPTYCGACPTACCSIPEDSSTVCDNGNKDCYTLSELLWGASCKPFSNP